MLETHGHPGSIALDRLHEVGSEDLGAYNRLADASVWQYVDSMNMSAELGTQKGAKISDVGTGKCLECVVTNGEGLRVSFL